MPAVTPRLDLEMLPYAYLRSALLLPIFLVILIDEKMIGQLQRITHVIVRVNKPDQHP
jgi:hypothetical protein